MQLREAGVGGLGKAWEARLGTQMGHPGRKSILGRGEDTRIGPLRTVGLDPASRQGWREGRL